MAAIDSVYNYYLTTYGKTSSSSRYDAHKKSELRDTYNRIVKSNKDAPLYKIQLNDETERFVIDLKERAKNAKNVAASLSMNGEGLEGLFHKKIAQSSDERSVGVEYIGEDDESERRAVVLSGMSAAFSAIFGTPMAAVVFPIEVISIGIMHYSALVPCAVASVTASVFAVNMGIRPEDFPKLVAPELTISSGLLILLLAVLAAWVSILFCVLLNRTGKLFGKYIENKYLRAAAGGVLIIALTFAVRSFDYNGAGVNVIERALNGEASPTAFLLKMLFTAITIEAGFKGGEIVPSFFIGATFGCVFGTLTGLSPQLCAAIGMSCVFCGVTNCPISTLLISFELFGFDGIPYYLLAIPVCYMMSEYYGLYKEQKIMYSKFRMHFINRKTQA